jgi:hypothetical protein
LPDEDAKYDKTDVIVTYEKELENAWQIIPWNKWNNAWLLSETSVS